MIYKINFLFVTLFGIGKLPKIPGSYASLATIILLFFLFHILKIWNKKNNNIIVARDA